MLAVYPGSFDPPTVAHLALAQAALGHVGEVRLVLSEVALGKEDLDGRVPVDERLAVLRAVTTRVRGLSASVTAARLVVDIAEEAGADAVVLGADKWAQVVDPAWYGGSAPARDAVLARLPRVLLAHRPGSPVAPVPGVEVVDLGIDPAHAEVSATRARAGEADLMVPEARASGLWTAPASAVSGDVGGGQPEPGAFLARTQDDAPVLSNRKDEDAARDAIWPG